MKLPLSTIWAEMARRKITFYPNKEWSDIQLWGLFKWGDVSNLIKHGELLCDMSRENKIVWVRPTADTYQNRIKPLLDKYSENELTRLAGWDTNGIGYTYQLVNR